VVTMVWVVNRFGLKAPRGISSSCISPLTSSGQHSRASRASQPQKSAALSPQPGGKPRKFIRTCGDTGKKKKEKKNRYVEGTMFHYFSSMYIPLLIMYSQVTVNNYCQEPKHVVVP